MLIEKKKTVELLPAEYNPRKDLKPGDEEYEKLKRSIEEFGYVGFGEVLAVQTTAGHGVSHIGAELPVGGTGVNVRAAGPVTERIDLGIRKDFMQIAGLGVALAEDQAVAVQNVFAVATVGFIELLGDGGELFLLVSHRDAFEDAVVAAVDAVDLVVSR